MGASDASWSDAERSNPPGFLLRPRRRRCVNRGLQHAPHGERASASGVLRASACGLPIRPVLKHRPRSLTCVSSQTGE
ncbi:unnamed protein product [Brassica napus]|uniref:(rape) hypothetical protein n=1 Tax=Brassica napus TaxID=3708 RepID=A0A816SHJ6_BRANA|nr:unnamed protein product [Brassica napus]